MNWARTVKWDARYLYLSKTVSDWSKDPSTKVGSVIVNSNNEVVSLGYNGFPRGVEDTPLRLSERTVKYDMIVHGEMNAILFAKQSLEGCTLYTYPFQPCSRCAAQIIQTGIKRVVSFMSDDTRWLENFNLARDMFQEAGVTMDLYDYNSMHYSI